MFGCKDTCYKSKDSNVVVLGKLRFTYSQAFLLGLVPVLMMLTGTAVLTWSCLELLCCSPQVRVKMSLERQRSYEAKRRDLLNSLAADENDKLALRKQYYRGDSKRNTSVEEMQPMISSCTVNL